MRGTRRRTPAAAPAATRRRSALALYAEAFEAAGALDRLEGFASRFGADFYGLPRNADTVTLVREPWTVPAEYPFGEHAVVPLRAGETVRWRVSASTRKTLPAAAPNGEPCGAVLSYPSEASQTVAARATGGRKVRAPQSRMPGNAQPR